MNDYIYFCPQTGVIRDSAPKAPSNYYWYRLPNSFRGVIELAVKASSTDPAGFGYAPSFLRAIDKADTPDQYTNR